MKEFKVGDRVRFAEHPGNGYWGTIISDVGTIKEIDRTVKDTWYAVELDIRTAMAKAEQNVFGGAWLIVLDIVRT